MSTYDQDKDYFWHGESRKTQNLTAEELLKKIKQMMHYMNISSYASFERSSGIRTLFWRKLPWGQQRQQMRLNINLIKLTINYLGEDYDKMGSGWFGFSKMRPVVNFTISLIDMRHYLLRPALVSIYASLANEMEFAAEEKVQMRLIEEEYKTALGWIP